MKFKCLTTEEYIKYMKANWERRFAWFPVRISPTECIWLESYERLLLTATQCYYTGKVSFKYKYRYKDTEFID